MYCYNVLREPLLGLLLERLKSCLELEGAWQALEACLHGFQAVAESVHVSESNHLPAFFALLQTVPFNKLNIQVAITTLDVVGKISSQTFHYFLWQYILWGQQLDSNWKKELWREKGKKEDWFILSNSATNIYNRNFNVSLWDQSFGKSINKWIITYNLIITNPSIKTIFICLCSSLLFISNLLAEVFNIGHVVNVLFVARGVCGMDE